MQRSIGERLEPYEQGAGGSFNHVSRACNVAGVALMARGARVAPAAVVAGGLMCAGALAARWSTNRAGFQSAADPKYGSARSARRSGAATGRGPRDVNPRCT